MSRDSSPATSHRPIRSLLRRLIKAPAAFSILWPVLLFGAGYLAWHWWGAEHVASQYYGIDPTMIELSEPPDYIREEIAETVYRDTAMEDLSLLDPRATAKIASAFSMHPWIRRVVSVRKLPGGLVDVDAEYRRPVAMVYYRGADPTSGDSGKIGDYFYPVDGDGTMLPTEDFSWAQTRDDYIHIIVPGASPSAGVLGSRFGDRRVEYAAKLAAVLADYRERARIKSISTYGDRRLDSVPQFELTTFDGTRLAWGSPPGHELPGEPTAAMKLKALLGGPRNGSDLRMADAAD